MGNHLDQTNRPSLQEFGGWYNLGYERPDGIPVLHSQPWVPEFEHAEFFELYMAENAWFEKLVPASALKPFDPIADPPMFVKSDADDRTLCVCPDFDYLTLDLIKRIQREFLGRHPLWRVVLAADDPSCCIVIYPDTIRFGNLPLNISPEEALRDLSARAIALRDARERPRRDRVNFVQHRLPGAVRSIGNRPFVVIGALDNNRHEDDADDRLTIFLLTRSDQAGFALRGPPDIAGGIIGTGDRFNVDQSGTIVSDETPEAAVAYRVSFWHPPAGYHGPLTIVNRHTGEQYPYELKAEDITRIPPS
ncbi:MAG TPA: hypothetical protein VFE62_09460 [Gemmataceae bacterium]|nr:hypothetical protein [Gemmataceae bacterium]